MPLMNEFASKSYRLNVGIMLFNPQGLIFVGKRIKPVTSYWQMPQGGVKPGEDLMETARRELEEEAGTDRFEILQESSHWHVYDLPEDFFKPPAPLWNRKYRGQRQRWFLLRFLGRDADINLETAQPEFKRWKWSTPVTLIQEAVPFKQPIYQAVLEEFLPVMEGYGLKL